MEKLYIITRADLHQGLQFAQGCHALQAMNDQHAEAIEAWKGNLVCLCVPNMLALSELLCRLQRQGFAVASFSEPDLGGELTAIAVEGSAGRQLSSLPLAMREPPLARVA